MTLPAAELRARLAAPPPVFHALGVRELVPPSHRAHFDSVVAAERSGFHAPATPPHVSRYAPAPPPPPALAAHTAPPTAADGRPSWFNEANRVAREERGDPFGLGPAREDGAQDDCCVS